MTDNIAKLIVNRALAPDPFTEDALALRFSERHANDLRYLATRGQWFKWDGQRWKPEPTHLAFNLARQSCRDDAEFYGNGKAPAGVSSKKTAAAVEYMAKADRRHATTVEQWDADPYLLSAAGTTIDLRTGLGERSDPKSYITKTTAVAPPDTTVAPPDTPHPIWTSFLDRITAGNCELQSFLLRYIGYCCTADTKEHKFVFAYGTGANGKGTFINTIASILGDYATTADVGTFIASRNERHPADVAKLHGARLVVAQETDRGRRWDEAKIKMMTGGDKMTARFMRQDFFDFVPTFKLFITGNHKPGLNNVDEAMRRRLLLVPFTVQIPVEERDPALRDKLVDEWPAILRWIIDGCLEWQRIGLAPPEIVTDATNGYFDDQDATKQWLEECTEGAPRTARILGSQLFASWKRWAEERNVEVGGVRGLTEALEERRFERYRDRRGRGFLGLQLKALDAT
jgi:putative DNA primase/helicase